MKIPKPAIESHSKSIFISHAVVDKEFADKVVDLLSTGIGIDAHNDVFCSSLEGIKIPPGVDFKSFVKDQIQHPKIIVLLISQNYLVSQFCLAELGASWAMSHRIIPMLIPPVRYDDLKAVLVNIQALKILDPNDWNEALAVFKGELKIDPNINRWERKRDEHLEALKALIHKQTPPQIVSLAKYQTIEEKVKDANAEIKQLEGEVDRLSAIISKLKGAKNAKEVAQIEIESLPANKAFTQLVRAAQKEMQPLPNIVCEALFYYFRDERLILGGYGDEDSQQDATKALEHELLVNYGEEGLGVADSAPKVTRAIAALKELEKFVDKPPNGFSAAYMEEHDEELSFRSRTFWDTHLL